MHFEDFITRLKNSMALPLPGEDAQYRMAPSARLKLNHYLEKGIQPRQSSVLLLIYPAAGAIHILLTLRNDYKGVHSGQVSFPGGKFEEEDVDPIHTALRETREEVGVHVDIKNVIGSLTPLYIPVSNFLVHPFVAFQHKQPAFTANAYEVKQLIEFPIHTLLDDTLVVQKTVLHSSGIKIETPSFNIDGFTVWGATAMVLSELKEVIKKMEGK